MDSVQAYLNSIKNYPVLPHEEHIRLFKIYRDPNSDEKSKSSAFDRLVTCNLKFVVSVAKQYIKYNVAFNELISAGNEGLIRAVKNYDPNKNFKFTTYGVWWIRQGILQTITENTNIIHIPSNRQYDLQKIRRLEEKLVQELARPLTHSELVELSQYSNLNLVNLNNIISLNGLDENDHEIIHTFVNPAEDNLEKSIEDLDTREFINELLEDCSFKEKDILTLYMGLNDIKPLTLEQIGKLYNLSRERIRQIKELTLQKLKNKQKK